MIITKKSIKLIHSCNLLRTSFIQRCMKEDVLAAVIMFELTLFQIIRLRNDILFCYFIAVQRGISSAICDLLL